MYPKIKKKKNEVKVSVSNFVNNIKAILSDCISVFRSGECFLMFLKKSFHF